LELKCKCTVPVFSIRSIAFPLILRAVRRARGRFVKWEQKKLLGVGLKVIAPTGQYDPAKLINWGTNRWSFKPELGYSQAWGKWVLDAYTGVWFFTKNPEFWSHNVNYHGTRSQSQNPVAAFEGHLSYDFKPRLWVSLNRLTLASEPRCQSR